MHYIAQLVDKVATSRASHLEQKSSSHTDEVGVLAGLTTPPAVASNDAHRIELRWEIEVGPLLEML